MNTPATIDRSADSVVAALEHSRRFLADAVEMTGPAEIAMEKAKIVMAETYSRELQLSKEIQQDAQEMVRRAEYALGKAIRKGQDEGTIRRQGEGSKDSQLPGENRKLSPYEFSTMDEMTGNGAGIMHLADGIAPERFDSALTEAKAEGNLSRANVVRKVKQQAGPSTQTRQQRADLIEELAAQGYSSRQMPAKVGVTEETVRIIAREFGIEIPADRSVGRSRRINSTQVVENTATALEGLVMGVELIDYAAVDCDTASQWIDSLNESMRALNRFVRQIKETTQ